MQSASGSSLQLRYIPEVTPGVTPDSGNHTNLRATGSTLKYDVRSETSKEIRADRMTTDSVLVSASTSGGVPFELSYKEFDPFIAAVLQSTWGAGVTFSGDAYIDVTTDAVLTAASGTPFASLVAGQYVSVSSTGNGAKLARIKSKTDSALTFDAAEGFVDEGSVGTPVTIAVKSNRIKNGVTMQYFTLEEYYSDITQFRAFRGMTPGKLSLSFETGAILGGTIDFMGYTASVGATTFLPGTTTASQTYDVMNSVIGVGNVFEAGAPLTGTAFKSLRLDIDNALRGQEAIGTLGYVGIGSGSLQVTGTIEAYFANADLYNKFIANEDTSLSWYAKDPDGNGYGFVLPKVKYTTGDITGGSLNSDVMVSLGFSALLDPTTGCMIAVDRCGA